MYIDRLNKLKNYYENKLNDIKKCKNLLLTTNIATKSYDIDESIRHLNKVIDTNSKKLDKFINLIKEYNNLEKRENKIKIKYFESEYSNYDIKEINNIFNNISEFEVIPFMSYYYDGWRNIIILSSEQLKENEEKIIHNCIKDNYPDELRPNYTENKLLYWDGNDIYKK